MCRVHMTQIKTCKQTWRFEVVPGLSGLRLSGLGGLVSGAGVGSGSRIRCRTSSESWDQQTGLVSNRAPSVHLTRVNSSMYSWHALHLGRARTVWQWGDIRSATTAIIAHAITDWVWERRPVVYVNNCKLNSVFKGHKGFWGNGNLIN